MLLFRILIAQLLIFGLSVSAHAAVAYAENAYNDHKHSAHIQAGFTRGGFALGAEYENHSHRTFGIGGYAKFHPDNDDPAANGLMALGGFVRPHFHKRTWDLYLTLGFGIAQVEPAGSGDDETGIGPMMGFGLTYQFTTTFALGLDNGNYFAWFNDDVRGKVAEDLLVKARFSF